MVGVPFDVEQTAVFCIPPRLPGKETIARWDLVTIRDGVLHDILVLNRIPLVAFKEGMS